jgi:hypothetical protein
MRQHATLAEQSWSEDLVRRPYFDPSTSLDVYHLAFQYAMTARGVVPSGTTFSEIEPLLAEHWRTYRVKTGVPWDQIRDAVEDVWNRAHELAADDASLHGRFKEPPTFSKHGLATPRSIDEPNQ